MAIKEKSHRNAQSQWGRQKTVSLLKQSLGKCLRDEGEFHPVRFGCQGRTQGIVDGRIPTAHLVARRREGSFQSGRVGDSVLDDGEFFEWKNRRALMDTDGNNRHKLIAELGICPNPS